MRSRRLNTGWRSHWPRFLLVIPFLGVLWVPFYNRIERANAAVMDSQSSEWRFARIACTRARSATVHGFAL